MEQLNDKSQRILLQTAPFGTLFPSSPLVQRLGVDVFSAVTASIAVAPVVTIIDIAVTQAAFRIKTVPQSIQASIQKLFLRPHQFFISRPFAVILLLYCSTFVTANTVETLTRAYGLHSGLKLFAVTSVNGALSLYKDSQFAKVFVSKSAVTATQTPMRMAVLAPWLIRDFGTLSATFSLPPVLASSLGVPLGFAQLLAPAISQPMVALLHLVGLDAYNNPERTALRARWSRVRMVWGPVSLAKMGRVLPGLGVANLFNSSVKQRLLN